MANICGLGALALMIAALGFIAVAGGATLGYFADRLPELRKADRGRPDSTGRLAGAHHGDR